MNKNLDYVVYDDFSVALLQEETKTNANPLLFIKSVWLKKSGGQGLIDYYEHTFFDNNQVEIKDNKLSFKGFYCVIERRETWRKINGSTGKVTLKIVIADKANESIEEFINMNKIPKIRFYSIFEYLKLIGIYGTHIAVKRIDHLEKEISQLKMDLNNRMIQDV